MRFFLHVMVFMSLTLFSGCSIKHTITASQPYLITIKTPQMAFSDTGFLNQGAGYTQLQIFNAGTVLFNLEMSHSICLNGSCFDKIEFNKHFFGTEHYETIMEDIINKKTLYEGQSKIIHSTGFTQKIDLPTSQIEYRIEGDTRYFKDSKNGILLRLKPLL